MEQPVMASTYVLVVDDDSFMRRTLEQELSVVFTVLVADGFTTAHALLEQGVEISVVVSDLQMGPGPDGLELLEIVSHRTPQCGRILLSGAVEDDSIMEALNSGIVHKFLAKPWRPGVVQAAVWQVLWNLWKQGKKRVRELKSE